MQMIDISAARLAIDIVNQFTVYQGEIKTRTISLKKNSTAFAHVSVPLQFEQRDG